MSDHDPLLRPFLDATDHEAARLRLGELIECHAAPLALEVIRGHLRGTPLDDLEDVHAGVLLRLTAHLGGLRTRAASEAPIGTLTGYVAQTAHNACHAFLRERAPQRARLRARARYVLTRDPRLALWEGSRRGWVCGRAADRDEPPHPDSRPALAELGGRLAPLAFPDLVAALMGRLPGPARFDDLVDALAAILGISDEAGRGRTRDQEDESPLREVPDPGPGADERIEKRTFLARLWEEIRELPARQRQALLLNLRDAEGRGMLALFPLTGIATMADIAAALEVPPASLQEIWDDLPRDDEWIAVRLGATRRQVINLRKCARERLARRLRRDGW